MYPGHRHYREGSPAPSRQDDTRPETFRLSNVSLEVEGTGIFAGLTAMSSGRRIGIAGRNGAGKSTFARMLAGLSPISAGQIRVNGFDPARDRRAALSDIGILFQNPEHQIIFPTVAEEMTFGLRQQGLGRQQAADRVRQALARHGRSHWETAQTHSLSQGQKHLLCLMSLELMQPRILILDEPFAGLDIPTHMQLSRRLAAWPGTLIHISHDPRDFESCDDLLWLDNGRIRAQGTPSQVLPLYLATMHAEGERDDLADLAP